jgi:glycosyltransferase involved in cell wall biosynthesis
VVRETSTPSIIAARARTWTNWLQLALVRALYRFADHIIAPSEGVRNDLTATLHLPVRMVHVIRNPVSFDLIDRQGAEPVAHPLFVEPAAPVILGVGRLSRQKDFATLIHAFSSVRRTTVAKLVILGDGEQRGDLEDLVERLGLLDDVLFAGFVENPYAYLSRSSVYVLSSPSEGLPNTLLEALAMGIPAVATDCPSGPAEILEGGRWGRLVPVGDSVAMADGIIAALAGNLLKPTRAELIARYGIRTIVQKYVALLSASDASGFQTSTRSTWQDQTQVTQ